MERPVIVVHGGAGTYGAGQHPTYVAACRRAAIAAWDVLVGGGSALDAVETAVRSLEDDPTVDAGRGSYFNRLGVAQMDAIIMDGRSLNFGAVAAVEGVLHPISLARAVMERSEHSFIVGRGAEEFARSLGIAFAAPGELLGKAGEPDAPGAPTDTVGAVALDLNGDFAVATSTGGIADKWPGRVGDSPLVGCGGYADNLTGAASATGVGEMLMRIVTTKTACDMLGCGMSAQDAAAAVIRLLAERTGGEGGIILIDREGRVGVAHNSRDMAHAYISGDRELVVLPR